jgi:hypothetical protein
MTEQKNQSKIFSDRPVTDLTRNLIWKDKDVIREQIDNVAARISEAISASKSYVDRLDYSSSRLSSQADDLSDMGSITFGIHGPWGSGKTSFAKMVLSQVRKNLGDTHTDLLECYYQSASFDGMEIGAKASLALQILLALANGNKEQAIKIFKIRSEQIPEEEYDDTYKKEYEDMYKKAKNGVINQSQLLTWQSDSLEQIANRLKSLSDFPDIIESELSGKGTTAVNSHRTMVVVVDDLDRCSHRFINSILEAIQHWSGVKNLYFILAIDQAVLNLAIGEKLGDTSHQPGVSPQVALEKYIQYSVNIPVLDEGQVINFVSDFLEPFDDVVSQIFKDGSSLIARGIRVPTPRGIKKCLNTLRPDLSIAEHINRKAASNNETLDTVQEALDYSPKETNQNPKDNAKIARQHQLKELLLAYTWSDFHRNYYLRGKVKLKGKENQFSSALAAIEKASTDYEAEGDFEQLEFSLTRIRSRLNVSSSDMPIDELLVKFLALEPWFFLKDKNLSLQDTLLGIVPADQGGEIRPIPTAVEMLQQKSPIRQVEAYSKSARTAHRQGDQRTVVECAMQALDLVDELGGLSAFTPAEVADFGNMALYIEKVSIETENPGVQQLTFSLYDVAWKIDPNHVNNKLNFVSFILDSKYPPLKDKYSFCDEILGDEQSCLKSGQFSRYLSYNAHLEFLKDPLSLQWRVWINKLLNFIESGEQEETSPFKRLCSFYSATNDQPDQDLLRQAARLRIPQISGQDRAIEMLLYADRLDKNTKNPEHPDVREAFEIYNYILGSVELGGVQDDDDNPYRGNAFHNFAVGLHRVGYLEEAGRCWYHSYQLLRNKKSGNLIPAYARYLREVCNRDDLAILVESESELDELATPLSTKNSIPVPEEFVEGGIRSIFNI